MKIPELYVILAEHFLEYAPLKGKGLVSKQIADYTVEITADGKTKDENDWEIEPFRFYIFKNGWLAGIVSPNGGPLLVSENDLIEIFKAELAKLEEMKKEKEIKSEEEENA